ncbi:MAG: UDP-N-acetylmuramyl-tripeptide synthetase [Patescibacteria group bacterium]
MSNILFFLKKISPKFVIKNIRPVYHYALAFLANVFYGNPSKKLIVIGVTGTSGKTSSVYLMAKALNEAGYKTGYTSTAMFGNGNEEWLNDKKMTMPGKFFNQKIIAEMVKNKCIYAIIETTSEGIRQFRHRFINYDIICFTGLYPEHIESHGSFENYKKAKGELFNHLKNCKSKYLNNDKRVVRIKNNLSKINFNKLKKTIIVNRDDDHAIYFSDFWSEEKMGYTRNEEEDQTQNIIYGNVNIASVGISFDIIFNYNKGEKQIEKRTIESPLIGDFNVLNLMPLLSVVINQEIDIDLIVESIKKIKNIPGRLELIDVGQKFLAMVDYAYEPVAMEKLYKTLDLIRNIDGKLIHVLGSAGGGRDKSRRSILGEMAGEKADYVIITNEDPYDENPLDIINQVAQGAKLKGKVEGVNIFRVLDRAEAIKKAVSLTGENDTILLTGKGNEQAICLADGKKKKWDDREVLKREIKSVLT